MYSIFKCNYLYRQLFHITPLNKEDENILLIKAQKGDNKALEKVLLHNFKTVIQVIKPCYANNKFDENDLFQEGAIALMNAVKTFNPSMGIKFSSYASYRIKKYINRYVNKNIFSLKVPTYIKSLINKVNKLENKFLEDNENNYSFTQYLSKSLDIDTSKADLLIRIRNEEFNNIDNEEEL